MNFQNCDIAIVGGGIIGLSVAMRLTQTFSRLKVVVIEKETEVARHQTGHNSGVIHAGIYYTPNSHKANFCTSGGMMLRAFADEHGIPYEECGKIIVATSDAERPRLEEVYRRGTANGAVGLRMIDGERLRELEPHASGVSAVFSPHTGIIDYVKVSKVYASVIKENGGEIFTGAEVMSISRRDGRTYLETTSGDISARCIINCAGLYADKIARMMDVDPGIRIIPFRGEYLSLRPERAHLVRGLIYPVPDPHLPFLGVHFTRRIDGSVEAGPNAVLAFAREGYGKTSFNMIEALDSLMFRGFWAMFLRYWREGMYEQYRSMIKSVFVKSLQMLVPEIEGDDLHDPGSGVRAQAVDRQGRLLQDFRITETDGAIHVLNAPSPGASASLAIGQYIVDFAQKSFGLKG